MQVRLDRDRFARDEREYRPKISRWRSERLATESRERATRL